VVLPDRDARALVAGLAGPGPVEVWIGGVRVTPGEAAGVDPDGRGEP
jgi:hypothetical protein